MYKIKKIYKCKDGRVRVRIITDENQSKVISYPKILMEEKLGRPLEPYEEVHHIDGDFTNNDISNLELVKHGEHQRHHSQKYYDNYYNKSDYFIINNGSVIDLENKLKEVIDEIYFIRK